MGYVITLCANLEHTNVVACLFKVFHYETNTVSQTQSELKANEAIGNFTESTNNYTDIKFKYKQVSISMYSWEHLFDYI